MDSENKKPFFIVVDGLDGSGKTTICNYIAEKTKAKYMRSFGQGAIGKTIRDHFLKKTNHYNIDVSFNWVLSANLEAIYDYVIPALSSGQSVVLDRYFSSTFAYQISRIGKDLTDTVNYYDPKLLYFQNLLSKVLEDAPVSLYIYCDVDIDNSLERISRRLEESNHYDLESRAQKIKTLMYYETFYKETKIENKYRLDCNETLDNVFKKVDEVLSLYNYI